MMSYTTPKKIQGYYMGLDFDKSDYIVKSEVKAWIAEYAALINSSLKRKYNIPITNADDLLILQVINEKFVVGKIDGILRQNATDEEKKFIRDRNCTKDANDLMGKIISGEMLLNTSPKLLSPISYNQGDYSGN